MRAPPANQPSPNTAAARLGLNTPLAEQLDRLPDLPNKPRPLWQRIVAGILLTSSLLVHTGQVLAQYQYGNGAYTPSGAYNPAPFTSNNTGYAPNGQLYLAGQPYKEPQAHIDARNVANSILYNAIVKGLSEPSASNPGFVHDNLGQIDSAAAILGGGAVRSATVIYFTTNNNIYGVNGGLNSPPPAPTPANPNQLANYNTYKDILTNAPGAGYQTVVAPPNAPNTPAVPYVNGPYLIKTADGSDGGLAGALFYNAPLSTLFEVAQSTQTPTGSSLIGGGVAANLNQDQTQVNHLAALSGGLVFASQAWIDPNNPNANNLNYTGDLGYLNRQGQVVGLNMDAANNASSSFSNDSGDASIDRQAWLRHLNQQAKTLDKREGFQIQANSLDLSGYNPTDLFRDGYDLYQYGKNQSNWQSNNDLLRRLQNGQLTPGSAEYNQASQIAQDRYRYAYATRLETNKPLKFSKEDAQRKANQLNLSDVDLFQQSAELGFDLFQYNPSLQPNGAAENALLARLKNGELTAGSSEYNQAVQIAQDRFRIAYSVALSPPPPKSVPKWKLIVGAVVGAVLTFVTAGALAPFVASALTAVAGTVVAATSLVVTSIAGVMASALGAIASTSITTGSLSQGLKAGGKALVSGSVKAIVANAIGAGFIGDIIGAAAGNTVAYGGNFGDNLQGAFINGVVNVVSADVAGYIGAKLPNVDGTNIANYAAHAVLGCASAAAKGGDCVAGATGAVVGEAAAATGAMNFVSMATTGQVLTTNESNFYAGVIGGAAAAAAGSADNAQANFNTGQAAGANAAEYNNAATIQRAAELIARAAQYGIQSLDAAGRAMVTACSGSSACTMAVTAILPASAIAYLTTQNRVITDNPAISQIPGYDGRVPPPDGSIPPFPITPDTQPNNTGNQNPVTNAGSNNTGGNQIQQPSGSNVVGGGFGAGTPANVGNGVVMSTVPPSILGSDGKLPAVTGVNGGAIERPATINPNQTAEQFARDAFNGQIPVATTPIKGDSGAWVAKLPDGTYVTYRPAGQASSATSGTTATVEVNNPSVRAINGNAPAKFKFPRL